MKFNATTHGSTKTPNLGGGVGFAVSPELNLLGILLTSFLKDSYYEKADRTLERLEEACEQVKDKEFLAKAAIYARTVFGMRSVSHVVAGHLGRNSTGMKAFFDKVVHRPDDMTEIAAYFFSKYKTTLPNAMKKGFVRAFARFSPYQLAKYRGEGKGVSLIDLANLVHPKHNETLAKLMTGKLKSTETWESKLSTSVQKATTEEEKAAIKKKVWTDMVSEKKLGYFALLRNLRNIIESAPELDRQVAEQLTNTEAIKKSLVLPFRYITAMKALETKNNRSIYNAVSKALDICLDNVPELPGKTLIVVDASGSMESVADKASLFAAALYKTNKSAHLMFFSDGASYVSVVEDAPVSALAKEIRASMVGGGTNFHAIFQVAEQPYDNIIILSDMQAWVKQPYGDNTPGPALAAYKKKYSANPKVFSFDLAGYGSLQFPEPEVYALAGVSEKTFDILKMLTEDKHALVNTIKAIELF